MFHTPTPAVHKTRKRRFELNSRILGHRNLIYLIDAKTHFLEATLDGTNRKKHRSVSLDQGAPLG